MVAAIGVVIWEATAAFMAAMVAMEAGTAANGEAVTGAAMMTAAGVGCTGIVSGFATDAMDDDILRHQHHGVLFALRCARDGYWRRRDARRLAFLHIVNRVPVVWRLWKRDAMEIMRAASQQIGHGK